MYPQLVLALKPASTPFVELFLLEALANLVFSPGDRGPLAQLVRFFNGGLPLQPDPH